MIEVHLQVPDSANAEAVIRAVEDVCASHALICISKGTLLRYSSGVHWHFKKGRQKGTLEITWWESENRLWFKVASNRNNTWIAESLSLLKERMERALLIPHG